MVVAAGFVDVKDRGERGTKGDSKFVASSPGRMSRENSVYKGSEVGTRLAFCIQNTL